MQTMRVVWVLLFWMTASLAFAQSRGAEVFYSSYLGGREPDIAQSVATDRQGNIYVTGTTYSRDFPVAAASVERALRIEPDNPLLWIELGKVQQAAGNYAQAGHTGKKALSLATGDLKAQVAAWQLIARSLRAQGRNDEALAADARADALMPD